MSIPRNLATLADNIDASGVLQASGGGTGATATPTAGGVLYGTGSAQAATAAGTTGQALVSNGASAPAFATLGVAGGGTNSTATPTAGGVGYGTGTAHAYSAVGTTGQALVSAGASAPAFGTLGVAGGGTNTTSTPTAGAVPYGTGTALEYTAVGTSGQYLQSAGAGTPTWTTLSAGFTLGTPTTASGTSINFTGVPVGVKQVIITFSDINFSAGADQIVIRLGVAGPTFPFAYSTFATIFSTSGFLATLFSNTGFLLPVEGTGTSTNGQYILTLQNSTTNLWVGTGISGNATGNQYSSFSSGKQTLTGALETIRIASRLGNSYSSGTINIAYI
jgi:hypothetical protein